MSELNLCDYVVEKSFEGKFQLTDRLNKRVSIYGFTDFEYARHEMAKVNAIKDAQELSHYISAVQYDVHENSCDFHHSYLD